MINLTYSIEGKDDSGNIFTRTVDSTVPTGTDNSWMKIERPENVASVSKVTVDGNNIMMLDDQGELWRTKSPVEIEALGKNENFADCIF